MPLFGARKNPHKPDDVALVVDVDGECSACRHRGMARLVAYYSGEIVIRCNNCKKAGHFTPSDKTYNNPRNFLPFVGSEDEK